MTKKLVRVVFELDPNAWHGSATEGLWAESLGKGKFRLRNSPFFAFGVSYEDVVLATNKHGIYWFTAAHVRSGRSTYRIMLRSRDLNDAQFVEAWGPLQKLGCSFEEGAVLAVDVPAAADIQKVYALLESGLNAGIWDFEEGHCGHMVDPKVDPQG